MYIFYLHPLLSRWWVLCVGSQRDSRHFDSQSSNAQFRISVYWAFLFFTAFRHGSHCSRSACLANATLAFKVSSVGLVVWDPLPVKAFSLLYFLLLPFGPCTTFDYEDFNTPSRRLDFRLENVDRKNWKEVCRVYKPQTLPPGQFSEPREGAPYVFLNLLAFSFSSLIYLDVLCA